MAEPIKHRYDFVLYFDVENGNPNGDPDAGNLPRVTPEDGHGIVTDVCIKRKVRNYIEAAKEDEPGFDIYIKEGVPLNRSDRRAVEAVGMDPDQKDLAAAIKKAKKTNPELDVMIRDYMCQTFYDVRTFGAVMTTFVKGNLNCGQVRGPVQFTFSRSVDPIIPQEVTITRVAITTEEDAEKKGNEMGRKYVVPYGLYRMEGFVSANLARKSTGFSNEDLELLWQALANMFEIDRSAARGKMSVRRLVVFEHESELGNEPSYKLFDRVTCQKKEGVDVPGSFSDYGPIVVNEEDMPAGVTVEVKV
ncbi:type I-C CRISPR-associated protein Cas7/Csd2 [Kribbibacterium absianum]|uniref:type I-C CRISPR-associated protein Cas7/Csd2 n=1 Tax=Kribbibacterium absianum TaxID=3044210 RepID=UPI0024BBF097|nr:type I-C CRISPR-associated protein Cas7/Csd2 [Olsenella sp. YH-ols2216]MDJ1122919.1 type I-C CRISPR-associated protein Cas7/Csd2 [Olsenella sp. YH-ols2216]